MHFLKDDLLEICKDSEFIYFEIKFTIQPNSI